MWMRVKTTNLAHQIHVLASKNTALETALFSAQLVYISTDNFWDSSTTYVEYNTLPNPINIYAKTKFEGAYKTLGYDFTLIVRTNFNGMCGHGGYHY